MDKSILMSKKYKIKHRGTKLYKHHFQGLLNDLFPKKRTRKYNNAETWKVNPTKIKKNEYNFLPSDIGLIENKNKLAATPARICVKSCKAKKFIIYVHIEANNKGVKSFIAQNLIVILINANTRKTIWTSCQIIYKSELKRR